MNSTCSKVSRTGVDSVTIGEYNYLIVRTIKLQYSYLVFSSVIAGIDYFTPHSLLYFGCMSILLAQINLSFRAYTFVAGNISYFQF